MILSRLFSRSRDGDPAFSLYRAAVEQARSPRFYLNLAVPDTLDGRFDMVVLHVFLLVDRLASEERGKALQQRIFDILFSDMDQSLREMGVGDLSVGKKVQKMAEAFYGRCRAYREALNSGSEAGLMQALKRNVFPDQAVEEATLAALSGYMRCVRRTLQAMPVDLLLRGDVAFDAVPDVAMGRQHKRQGGDET